MISIILFCLILDTLLIKIVENVYKNLISITDKIIFFFILSFLCLFVQFILIIYFKNFFKEKTRINIQRFYLIFVIGIVITGSLIGFITYQMLFSNHYDKILLIIITLTNYFIALIFIIDLCIIFISWFNLKRNLIVLFYFISITLIITSLIVNSIHSSLKINDRPNYIREYVGGVIDISISKYLILDNIYKLSSIFSFIFMWLSSLLLVNNYKVNPLRTMALWTIITLPLIYFIIVQFNLIFNPLLYSLDFDPISLLIIVIILNSLSQPIGGLTFAILFWNISRLINFDKDLKRFIIFSGTGILLIFASNQANNLTLTSYPPFGLATITILPIATFLTLIGIYNSALHVSANIAVRKYINNFAFESKLLDILGKAEMEKELQLTVTHIVKKHNLLEVPEKDIELKDKELNTYIDNILKELKGKKY